MTPILSTIPKESHRLPQPATASGGGRAHQFTRRGRCNDVVSRETKMRPRSWCNAWFCGTPILLMADSDETDSRRSSSGTSPQTSDWATQMPAPLTRPVAELWRSAARASSMLNTAPRVGATSLGRCWAPVATATDAGRERRLASRKARGTHAVGSRRPGNRRRETALLLDPERRAPRRATHAAAEHRSGSSEGGRTIEITRRGRCNDVVSRGTRMRPRSRCNAWFGVPFSPLRVPTLSKSWASTDSAHPPEGFIATDQVGCKAL